MPKIMGLPAINRRSWLYAAAITVFGAGALFNPKRVFAEAQVSQSPILSAAALSALLIRDRALLAEFANDPVRFMHSRFGLTPANSAFLAHFAPQDLDSARQAAQLALGANRALVFQPANSWLDATPSHSGGRTHRRQAPPCYCSPGCFGRAASGASDRLLPGEHLRPGESGTRRWQRN